MLDFNYSKMLKLNPNKVVLVILHHTASEGQTVEQIHQGHKKLGWAGIGYHYYVRKDGHVYVGRPNDYVGSHCKGNNSCSIGIALEGDFRKTKPTKEQIESVKEIIKSVRAKYPKIKRVLNHKDLFPTLCPVVDLKFMVTNNKNGDL